MKAYELIDSPDKWCQGVWARDISGCAVVVMDNAGKSVKPLDSKAVRMCMVAAVHQCYEKPERDEKIDKLWFFLRDLYAKEQTQEMTEQFGPVSFSTVGFNDHPQRTHTHVINLLKHLDI